MFKPAVQFEVSEEVASAYKKVKYRKLQGMIADISEDGTKVTYNLNKKNRYFEPI